MLVNLLSELYDFVDDFWVIGLTLSAVFTVLTILAIGWAYNIPVITDGNAVTQILKPLYYLRWLVILGPGIPMLLFVTKTYQSWSKSRY